MFAKTAPPVAKPRGRSKPVAGKGRSERKDAVPTERAGNILDSDASDSSDVVDEGGPGHEASDQGKSPGRFSGGVRVLVATAQAHLTPYPHSAWMQLDVPCTCPHTLKHRLAEYPCCSS